MGKQHAPGFLKIVTDAKSRVRECTVDDVKSRCAEEDVAPGGEGQQPRAGKEEDGRQFGGQQGQSHCYSPGVSGG